MAFKFYLDNQLTDSPGGDKLLRTTIKRDSNLGALLVSQDSSLIYYKNNNPDAGELSGYDYIIQQFESDTFCGEIDVKIFDQISTNQTVLLYQGVLKLSDCIFEEQPCSVSVKIQDNSFYSYINNNKSIKVALTSDRTKNKLRITPPDIYEGEFFDSRSGFHNFTQFVHCYRIYDVFKFVVAAISDNKVTFQSDYLTSLQEELFLTQGYCIRVKDVDPSPVIEVSFEELYNEIYKLENVLFFIDASDSENPVLRLENSDYFFNQTQVYSFEDIKGLRRSTKIDKLYGTVEVGSNKLSPGADSPTSPYTFNEGTSYFGFKKESFYPLGQCNLDTKLNLVNDWILSSNAINDSFVGNNSEYDDSLFIVEMDQWDDVLLTCRAGGHNFFAAGPPYFYNSNLNNAAKIDRHYSSFQNNVVNFFGMGSDGFQASAGADSLFLAGSNIMPLVPLTINPFPFPDETTPPSYDGNGNYNSTTYEYTVPADGIYSFSASLDYEMSGFGNPNSDFLQVQSQFSITGTGQIITGGGANTVNHYSNTTHNKSNTATFQAFAGDVITYGVTLLISGTFTNPATSRVVIKASSYITCNGTPDNQITLATNVNNYKIQQFEFTTAIPELDFLDILANPIGLFKFEKDNNDRYGWIDSITYDNQTGNANVKLINSDATTP